MAAHNPDYPGVFSPPVVRRALRFFLPAALLTIGVVLALYYLDRANEHTLHEQASAHLVELHANIITRELDSVKSDLLFLSNEGILRNFVTQSDADKRALEDEYVLFSTRKGVYDQIRFLDMNGMERIRINYNDGAPAPVLAVDLQPKGDRYYFRQTILLAHDEVLVSPFDLNEEHGQIETNPYKPVIRVATPVFDNSDRRTMRGIVVLNYLGASLLAKLKEVSTAFPKSAWLLNHEGYFLHGPTPADEWGFQLKHSRRLATYYPEAWQRMSAGDEGQFRTADGIFTYRVLGVRPKEQVIVSADNPDPDEADPTLIIVAHVPPDVLDSRATALLRRLLLLGGIVLALMFGLSWYLGHAGALRRNHERQLAESEGRLRNLSAQLMTAQEEERRSISRDLHDEMGQVVTAMTLDLQRAASASGSEKKNDLIGRAVHGAERLLATIHEIAARVRPSLLDDLGLKDALQSFLSDYEHRTGIVVRAELKFEHGDVPANVSENIYRIMQEALTNVTKHARATAVSVAIHVLQNWLVLTVCDNGIGFKPAATDVNRLGLLGMRERAELLNGDFKVKSEPGKGTEVIVGLPLD
jgi:signal transduction histidine kinase